MRFMEGLKLARDYYEAYGKAMLDEQFKDVKDRIAHQALLYHMLRNNLLLT